MNKNRWNIHADGHDTTENHPYRRKDAYDGREEPAPIAQYVDSAGIKSMSDACDNRLWRLIKKGSRASIEDGTYGHDYCCIKAPASITQRRSISDQSA